MSNRRKPGRHPWTPWTDRTPAHRRLTQTVQPGGRITVVAQGADAGALACIEAFRRAGATDVKCGYEPDTDVEPGRGFLEAAAQILRRGGATVDIRQPEAN